MTTYYIYNDKACLLGECHKHYEHQKVTQMLQSNEQHY